MLMGSMEGGAHPLDALSKLSKDLSLPLRISGLLSTLPRDTFKWKINLLKSAANYTNSQLHKVKAEVLVLASCLDNLFPSKTEAQRLKKLLINCKIHYFEDNGHNLLMEYGVHLPTTIKCAYMYRKSSKFERISDYLPPTITELTELEKASRELNIATCPVMFSTLEDGKVVPGLSGVPNNGPVLLVGNHMLLGLEMVPLVPRFLREKRVVLRGIGHPRLFPDKTENTSRGPDFFDFVNICGGVPLSAKYVYRLLANKEFVLLYPGGHREAIHRKGEEYKLLWSNQPEFVRMAAKFGATIVPFGTIGEDDFAELLLNFEELLRLPFGKEMIKAYSDNLHLREGDDEVFFPGIIPKIPGRFYYLFGKPINTKEMNQVLRDRKAAGDLYFFIKSEVERIISYLLKKREEDTYRSIVMRSLHKAVWGPDREIPTFEP